MKGGQHRAPPLFLLLLQQCRDQWKRRQDMNSRNRALIKGEVRFGANKNFRMSRFFEKDTLCHYGNSYSMFKPSFPAVK